MTIDEERVTAKTVREDLSKRISKGDVPCIVHSFRRAKRVSQWIEREPTTGEAIQIHVFGLCGVCSRRANQGLFKRHILEACAAGKSVKIL